MRPQDRTDVNRETAISPRVRPGQERLAGAENGELLCRVGSPNAPRCRPNCISNCITATSRAARKHRFCTPSRPASADLVVAPLFATCATFAHRPTISGNSLAIVNGAALPMYSRCAHPVLCAAGLCRIASSSAAGPWHSGRVTARTGRRMQHSHSTRSVGQWAPSIP